MSIFSFICVSEGQSMHHFLFISVVVQFVNVITIQSTLSLPTSVCLSVLRWRALLGYCLFWQPAIFLFFVFCLKLHWRIKNDWLID